MRKNKVQVWLRTKPSQKFANDFLTIQNDKKTVHIHIPKEEKSYIVNNQVSSWSFPFDGIFYNVSQENVFSSVGAEVVDSALNGFNSTIMCYGQTGAGKTFTLTGATENFNNRGIIPRAISYLYRRIEEDSNFAITVRISYLEIYNEQVYDLLSCFNTNIEGDSNLSIVEDEMGGVWVKGLGCHLAQTEEDALNLLFEGESNKTTAAHILNKRSSRSHCIFTVYLESRSRVQSQAQFSVAKLQFVDLAGSERLQKTQSTGKTQQEASYINKSLSFLEQTVIALSDKQREHIPFRQSKLTHFLKDSIGGNCKTILISNVWAEMEHVEETISTMRFAMRMMRVNSEPIVNIEYDPTILVRNLQKEITALKHELNMHDALRNRGHLTYEPLSDQQKFDIREQVRKYVEGEISELDIINVRQIEGVYEAFRSIYRSTKQEYEEKLKNLSVSGVQNQPVAQVPVNSSPQGKQSKREQREKAAASGATAPVVTSETPQISQPSPKVGEIDRTSGFSVGQADRNLLDENGSYLQSRKKDKKRNVMSVASKSNLTKDFITNNDKQQVSGDKINEVPTRSEAFEEFKKEYGQEISNILLENKEILSNKKKEYSALANKINNIKLEIDKGRLNLETMRLEREFQGPNYTNDGELIITEEEYQEIQKLNNNKKEYRQFYEDLKNLNSAILHCQKMVDLTRQRLIKEFDSWYSESYLDGEVNSDGKGTETNNDLNYEDPLEKFDAVKHLKFEGKSNEEAYSRAKESLKHRKIFGEALNQPQPIRRKPGTPVLINKTNNLLPKKMEIIQSN